LTTGHSYIQSSDVQFPYRVTYNPDGSENICDGVELTYPAGCYYHVPLTPLGQSVITQAGYFLYRVNGSNTVVLHPRDGLIGYFITIPNINNHIRMTPGLVAE
jgi:hypothetical protein